MIGSIICAFLALVVAVNAQTPCLPGKYCTTVAAIAGTYATAQACINACPAGTFVSYAFAGTQWCGCATSCNSQVPNPDYNTYCPTTATPSFKPTATPVPSAKPTATPVPSAKPTATAVPSAKPTAAATGFNKCFPGQYCSYNMIVQPGQVASVSACATACTGQSFFTYVASSGWCGCAGAGQCSAATRYANPGADTYCI